METQRLKTIQVPDQTLEMLESFAVAVLGVPPEAYRVKRLAELPPQLRRHIGTKADQQYIWFAWSIGEQTSLLTGALEFEQSRERGRPVLEVRSYDADGRLEEAAAWIRNGPTDWVRCNW